MSKTPLLRRVGFVTIPILLTVVSAVAFYSRPRPAVAGAGDAGLPPTPGVRGSAADSQPTRRPVREPRTPAARDRNPDRGSTDDGGPTEVLTVAAADSPPDRRAVADFVCDGIHDEVEIQAALDSFGNYQANPWGGVVQLMRGSYYIGAPISFRGARALRGEGVRGTVLWLADGANCNMIEYRVRPDQTQKENFSYIEALYLYGNKQHNTVGNGIYTERTNPAYPTLDLGLWDTTLRDVNIMNFAQNGIYLEQVWGWVIDSVIVEFCGGHGVYLTKGSNGKICNCKFMENTNAGLYLRAVANMMVSNTEMGGGSGGYGAVCVTDCLTVQMTNCLLVGEAAVGLWLRGNTRNCTFVNVAAGANSSGTAVRLTTYNGQAPYENSFIGCDLSSAAFAVSDVTGRNDFAYCRGFVTEKCSSLYVYGTPDGPSVFAVPHGLAAQVPANMTRHFQIVPTNAEMAQADYYLSNPDPDGTGTLVEITFLSPPPVRAVLNFDLCARLERSD